MSMTVIRGATIVAAEAPAIKSEASRKPRFFVFHVFFTSCRGSEAFAERVIGTTFEFASIFGAGGVSPEVCDVMARALIL